MNKHEKLEDLNERLLKEVDRLNRLPYGELSYYARRTFLTEPKLSKILDSVLLSIDNLTNLRVNMNTVGDDYAEQCDVSEILQEGQRE